MFLIYFYGDGLVGVNVGVTVGVTEGDGGIVAVSVGVIV